ncbi:MAG: hypothetical protein J0653_06390, partial [Deltaproteobacteria bacterium]|nr:hypothetical protein [Deltaproteobacteria bacterium]
PPVDGVIVIRRRGAFDDDPNGFVRNLADTLEKISTEFEPGRRHEPRRLYDAKEYRAAVISAMTLMESTLRERLGKFPVSGMGRTTSMRDLIERAVSAQIISQEDRGR